MKPAPFEYHCPRTLDEALMLLATHGSEAKPLAGGQSLIPAMNFRLATPAVLIDLNGIRELSFITHGGALASPIRIGAMTRHRDLERSAIVAQHAPLITRTMPYVAHAAIRTRGTLGGSLAHADPAAELPAVMLALDATLTLTNRERSRDVRAEEFFVGLFATALEPGELLTEIAIPVLPKGSAVAFQEISRRHGDFALAGVAAAVSLDEAGRCNRARIALLSVGDRPTLAARAAQALVGRLPTADAIRAAADAAATHDIDPPGDIHASSRYRRHLVNVLTRRTLEEAFRASESQ
jgi:carbon-monoxide dehydrogenase medium subunit